MNIIKDIFLYVFTTFYIWLYGDEKLEVKKLNTIIFDMKIKEEMFHCICTESRFDITFSKRLTLKRSSRLYHVVMCKEGCKEQTEGWYPMLTPSSLKDTEYPAHVAVKAHWRANYL